MSSTDTYLHADTHLPFGRFASPDPDSLSPEDDRWDGVAGSRSDSRATTYASARDSKMPEPQGCRTVDPRQSLSFSEKSRRPHDSRLTTNPQTRPARALRQRADSRTTLLDPLPSRPPRWILPTRRFSLLRKPGKSFPCKCCAPRVCRIGSNRNRNRNRSPLVQNSPCSCSSVVFASVGEMVHWHWGHFILVLPYLRSHAVDHWLHNGKHYWPA